MDKTTQEMLEQAATHAINYRRDGVTKSPYPTASADQLRASLDTGLPQTGRDGREIIAQLNEAAVPGLVGNTGDDFYSWVMGGSHLVGVAADWLTSAWGQNAGIYQTAPAAAIAEEIAGKWLIELLELPTESSVGFSTGATMASFICLAAARSEVLRRHGWDLEEDGMFGAPEISVFVSEEAHSTIFSGLRYLGFGASRLVMIKSDDQGRISFDDLADKIDQTNGPRIIISQAGHINTGAFDDFEALAALSEAHNAWLHVDGAFGLWAQAVPRLKHLSAGVEKADSWSVDGHKWLQVPYDSGFAIIKDERAHKIAMGMEASYLNRSAGDGRRPSDFVPELSRRARGFTVWAVLQALGRDGVVELVDANCRLAEQLADQIRDVPGITIPHEVCLNQLVFSFETDELTGKTIEALQAQKRWFIKEATWKDRKIVRVSFSSNFKDSAKIDAFAKAIIKTWQSIQSQST